VGYWVGRRYGRGFFEHYGRYVLLSPARLNSLEAFFTRHGDKTVLVARFVSGVRVLAAFFAGMSHMPWPTFFLYNATGAVLWAVTMSCLGYCFGRSWVTLEHWMGRAGLVVGAVVIIGVLCAALIRHARQLRIRVQTTIQTYIPKELGYRHLIIMVLILTAIALFSKLTEEVIMRETVGFDTRVLETLHATIPARFDWIEVGVTTLGSLPVLALVVLVGGGALWHRKAFRQLGVQVGVTLLSVTLNLLLKTGAHRVRPHLWAGPEVLTDYSFPSGHTMVSTAIYGIVAYLLSLHFPRFAWPVKLLAVGLIISIGLSRMALGVHWPTDVLGGYAAGTCVLFAGVYWYEGHAHRIYALMHHWGPTCPTHCKGTQP
jgi:membrane-associated phospholipid phosphatase